MYKVYHRLPANVEGNFLYPLNELQKRFPHIYELEMKKYENRRHVLEYKIPYLNCLWNDVLHFSPINPDIIAEAYKSAGGKWVTSKWLEVDPELAGFSSQNSIAFIGSKVSEQQSQLPEHDFEKFDLKRLTDLGELPEETQKHYRDEIAKDGRPLLFLWAPHILFRGSLEIAKYPIIEV